MRLVSSACPPTVARARQVSARHFLDAGDQLVDRLVDRHLLVDHPVHRLGPGVLVVQDGELLVLGELERQRAGLELVVHRLAMLVGLPERALLAFLGHREPAAERALDVRAEVVLLASGTSGTPWPSPCSWTPRRSRRPSPRCGRSSASRPASWGSPPSRSARHTPCGRRRAARRSGSRCWRRRATWRRSRSCSCASSPSSCCGRRRCCRDPSRSSTTAACSP